ncbi:hypothetical protein RHGRI_001274 [Rhododendron griersonianum]|uniref:Probable purine permease n=1 Tax=Rhododendron griersonianum TaxID=479676 RepID=A0AAV6LKS6_9ERIC|nr:hypothetical protein RHGRI_001274 [Rhododendron griersonianum]
MDDSDFVDLEEGSGETGEISNVCLVGKVLGTKMFNGPEGPWSVMNNLLVLSPLKAGAVVEEMDFSKCPFWVQIHGFPIEKMSRANAEIIGKRFGRLLAIETSPDNILLARSFLRVKVEINIDQPLPKGFWIRRKTSESKDLWISYKYEKLQDFCYACGRIGHESRGCGFVTREAGQESGYGPNLRTMRAKKGATPIEEFRQEVDEEEIRVENLLARRPVFQKGGMDAHNQEPLLIKDGASTDHETHFLRPMGRQWWVLASLNILFLLSGQTAGVILGRYYYDEGGSSTWMATLIQTAAFPILLIPYFIILPSSQNPSTTSTPPSITIISFVYFALGILFAGNNMLYSIGLLYLSASTFSLICATQLVFNAIFTFFINSQKFTVLIMNSVVVLTLSASLVGLNNDSDAPSGVSKWNYFLGFTSTIGASALYSPLLSLTQLWFQKVLKKETFSVVLEIQIFASLVATCVSVVGLFASGEWKTLEGEMDGFGKGRVAYVMTLVGAAIAWQVCSVGVVGLIFVVSSLFSNVIGTLSLALTPIAAVIVFHDAMNDIKVIALLLSLWGFSTYIYQNYLDDLKVKIMQTEVNEASNHSSC